MRFHIANSLATGNVDLTSATEMTPTTGHSFDKKEADAVWERMQEQALRAFRAGRAAEAKAGWARALEIAKQHFEWGDPRLATSYTNQAFSLIGEQRLHQAEPLFQTAIRCWDDSWRWVPLMTPPGTRGQTDEISYDKAAQKEFYDFIKRGQSITETLQHDRRPPMGGLEDWNQHRPKTMCDVRKLIASVFLIVSIAP